MKVRFESKYWNGWVAGILIILALVLGAIPLIPPALPADPAVTDFSAESAFAHIENISQEPHWIGSPAQSRVREYLLAELETLDLEIFVLPNEAYEYYRGTDERIEIVNIAARIPGTAPTMSIALSGHYDTHPNTLGANDDASAVAVMLESARAILAGPRPRQDIVLIFIDGEEPAPRFGSNAFVADYPGMDQITYVLNMEAIGTGGASLLIGLNGPERLLIEQYRSAAPHPVAYAFLSGMNKLVGGSNTDFATFQDAGIAGMEFAYAHGSTIYHTMDDDPESVSLRTLQMQGDNVLAFAKRLADLDQPIPPETAESVFFNFGRSIIIQHPASWMLPIAILTASMLIFITWREKAVKAWLRSLALSLALLTAAGTLSFGIWSVVAVQRNRMGIPEGYAYLTVFIGLTVGLHFLLARIGRRPFDLAAEALGILTAWWLFGLLLALTAPTMSYLFLWPAFLGSLVVMGRRIFPASAGVQAIFSALVLAALLVLLVPAVDVFFQFAQPRPGNLDSQILFMIIVPVIMVALFTDLAHALWPHSKIQAR